jgi:hypothetical protein
MVYGTYNYSYLGLINQIITGGPHIVVLHVFHLSDYRAGMSRATTSRRPAAVCGCVLGTQLVPQRNSWQALMNELPRKTPWHDDSWPSGSIKHLQTESSSRQRQLQGLACLQSTLPHMNFTRFDSKIEVEALDQQKQMWIQRKNFTRSHQPGRDPKRLTEDPWARCRWRASPNGGFASEGHDFLVMKSLKFQMESAFFLLTFHVSSWSWFFLVKSFSNTRFARWTSDERPP